MQQVRSLGMFKCRIVHVHVRMVNALLQKMSLVPRTSGDDTMANLPLGALHSGSNWESALHLETKMAVSAVRAARNPIAENRAMA